MTRDRPGGEDGLLRSVLPLLKTCVEMSIPMDDWNTRVSARACVHAPWGKCRGIFSTSESDVDISSVFSSTLL